MINDEWESIKCMIGEAAYKALGKIKQSFRKKKRRPRIWNSDIEKTVKEKQSNGTKPCTFEATLHSTGR